MHGGKFFFLPFTAFSLTIYSVKSQFKGKLSSSSVLSMSRHLSMLECALVDLSRRKNKQKLLNKFLSNEISFDFPSASKSFHNIFSLVHFLFFIIFFSKHPDKV